MIRKGQGLYEFRDGADCDRSGEKNATMYYGDLGAVAIYMK